MNPIFVFRNTFNLRTLSHRASKENDSDCDKITSFDSCCSFDAFKASVYHHDVIDHQDEDSYTFYKSSYKKTPRLSRGEGVILDERVNPDGSSDVHSSPTDSSGGTIHPSTSLPYLLTLQGNEEGLIHFLNKDEIFVGSDVIEFKLTAPDMHSQHCVIHRRGKSLD